MSYCKNLQYDTNISLAILFLFHSNFVSFLFLFHSKLHIHVITFIDLKQIESCIIDCTVLVRNENGREEHQLWNVWDLNITWFQIWFKKLAMASCWNIWNVKNWVIVEKSRLSNWSTLYKYGLMFCRQVDWEKSQDNEYFHPSIISWDLHQNFNIAVNINQNYY